MRYLGIVENLFMFKGFLTVKYVSYLIQNIILHFCDNVR